MINAAHALNMDALGMFLGQVLLTALVCAAYFVFDTPGPALAAVYGGAIALTGSWLAYRSTRSALRAEAAASLYGGLTLRLTAMIALFAIAFGVFELPPLPVIAGFAAAQLAPLASLFTHHLRESTWRKSTQ